MYENLKDYTPEELAFNFTLNGLRAIAKELKIKNIHQMNKIVLALNIEYILNKEKYK